MAEFLLVIITVIIVGLGAYLLGRLQQRDRIDFLIDELEAQRSLALDLLRVKGITKDRGLHVVKEEE